MIDMRMTQAFRSSQMVLSLLERTGFNLFSVFSGKQCDCDNTPPQSRPIATGHRGGIKLSTAHSFVERNLSHIYDWSEPQSKKMQLKNK